MFLFKNIVISFGSTSRRGILSTVHYKLAIILACSEGFKLDSINNSYNLYSKLLTQPIWNPTVDKYNPEKELKLFEYLDNYFKVHEKDFVLDFNKFLLNLEKDILSLIKN